MWRLLSASASAAASASASASASAAASPPSRDHHLSVMPPWPGMVSAKSLILNALLNPPEVGRVTLDINRIWDSNAIVIVMYREYEIKCMF